MKTKYYRLHVFQPGTRTAANGVTLNYSEDTLAEVADTFSPKRRIPLTLGHNPAGHMPSLGWVKDVITENGDLYCVVKSTPAGTVLLDNRYYDNLSASFYPPNAVANPTPGKWSLRHVAALGAEPPALKELDPIFEIINLDYSEISEEDLDPEIIASFDDIEDKEELLSSFVFSEARVIELTDPVDFRSFTRYGKNIKCKVGFRRCGGMCLEEGKKCWKDSGGKPKSKCADGEYFKDGKCQNKSNSQPGYPWKSLAKGVALATASVAVRIAVKELSDGSPYANAAADIALNVLKGQVVLNSDVDMKTRMSRALYDTATGALQGGMTVLFEDNKDVINSSAAKQFTRAGISAIDTALGRFLFSGKVDGTAAAISNAFDFALMAGYDTFRKDPHKDNTVDDLTELNKSLVGNPRDPGRLALKTDIAEALAVKNREDNKQFDALSTRVNILQNKLNKFEKVTNGLVEAIGDLNEDELASLLARSQSGEMTQEELKKFANWLALPIFMQMAKYMDKSNQDVLDYKEGNVVTISLDSVFNGNVEYSESKPERECLSLNSFFNNTENNINFNEDTSTMSVNSFFNFSEASSYLDELLESEDDDQAEILHEEQEPEQEEEESRLVEASPREKSLLSNENENNHPGSFDDFIDERVIALQRKIKELERKERDEAINQQVALLYSEAKIFPHEIYQPDMVRLLIELDKLSTDEVINFSETGRSVPSNPVDIILKILKSSESKLSPEIEIAEEDDSIESLSFSDGFSRESQILHYKVEKLLKINPTLTYDQALAVVMRGNNP